ncbi:hypothetical protein TNCV_2742831 [Trichonephila clavipes]|nr:hypothetical protein TNCV_2742831 [Trichonephila clavipes]
MNILAGKANKFIAEAQFSADILIGLRRSLYYFVGGGVSFPKKRKESCQSLRQVGLLHDRWRHHLSPPPQFRHGLEGREIFFTPCTRGFSCDCPQDFWTPWFNEHVLCVYSEGIWWHRIRPSRMESDALTPRLLLVAVHRPLVFRMYSWMKRMTTITSKGRESTYMKCRFKKNVSFWTTRSANVKFGEHGSFVS